MSKLIRSILSIGLSALVLTVLSCASPSGGGGGGGSKLSAPSSVSFNMLGWMSSPTFAFLRVGGHSGTLQTINTGGYMTALVYGSNGTLYGVENQLFTMNTTTGVATLIGPLNLGSETQILMCAAAVSPSGTLYVLENGSLKRLFTVNVATGALTLVGTVQAVVRSIAFASDGTLYAGFSSLYKLNPANGATVATVGALGSSGYLNSLFFDTTGTLFGSTPGGAMLWINYETGASKTMLTMATTSLSALIPEKNSPSALFQLAPVAPAASAAQPSADDVDAARAVMDAQEAAAH